jgi:hypothetical protein
VSDGKISYLEKNGLGKQYPGSFSVGKESYYFNEVVIPIKIVYGMLDGNEPMLNLELKDHLNQTQYSKCFLPKMYYAYNNFNNTNRGKNINIHQNISESGEVSINIHQTSKLANIMKNLFTIELSVVPKKLCAPNV